VLPPKDLAGLGKSVVEKKNGILKFASIWMELGKKILSEVTQTQKD